MRTVNLEYEGIDFLYQMRLALGVPLFRGMAEPELALIQGEGREEFQPPWARGKVYGGFTRHEENLIVLHLWPNRRRMAALSTLLHEMVHLRLGPGVGHRPLFRRTFQEAARQVYGIRVPWASCAAMGRDVQWGLAHMANRGFWESIADAQAGRWHPPLYEDRGPSSVHSTRPR